MQPVNPKSTAANPLATLLRDVLGAPQEGIMHGDHRCETPLDQFFSKLDSLYRTFDNKFLRAELAEKVLINCLLDNSSLFRSGSSMPQADMEWLDNGVWKPVSIKYKGPNKSGPPYFNSQLSALAWSKNASGVEPTQLTCDILLIWDADFNSSIEPQRPPATRANFERGLVVIPPEQFNPYYRPVNADQQNKTNCAFRIETCRHAMARAENWVRNAGDCRISRVQDASLRMHFEVRRTRDEERATP